MNLPARVICRFAATCAWVLLFSCLTHGAEKPDTTEAGNAAAQDPTFFRRRVQPILEQHCAACHDADTKESGLDLTSPAGILLGGETGLAVVARKPDDSLMLRRVRAGEMPPEDTADPLSPEEIEALEEWIRAGAGFGDVEIAKTELSQHDIRPILTLRRVSQHTSPIWRPQFDEQGTHAHRRRQRSGDHAGRRQRKPARPARRRGAVPTAATAA